MADLVEVVPGVRRCASKNLPDFTTRLGRRIRSDDNWVAESVGPVRRARGPRT